MLISRKSQEVTARMGETGNAYRILAINHNGNLLHDRQGGLFWFTVDGIVLWTLKLAILNLGILLQEICFLTQIF